MSRVSVAAVRRPTDRLRALRDPASPVVAVLVIAFLLSFALNGFALSVANTALYYVMLAIGLNLVIGMTGQLDFGHAGFFAVAAYLSAKLMLGSPDMNFLVVMAIAIAAAGGLSAVLGLPIFRFRGDYLALVSLAFAEIIHSLAVNLSWTNGANGLPGIPPAVLFGKTFTDPIDLYRLGLLLVAIMAIGVLVFMRSRPGRALLAIREDELAAQAVGIRLLRYKLVAFVLAGAMAGVAGAYFSAQLGFVGPESFGVDQTIIIALMVFLGGLGSVFGSILGATLYVSIQAVLINYVSALSGHVDLVMGAIMLAFILLRPQGIAGVPFVRRRA